jgi:hypothetical protein
MKSINITPNLVTSIISIIFGIFIFLKIPTEVEKPLLLFGQSSSEIDPKIVPGIRSSFKVKRGQNIQKIYEKIRRKHEIYEWSRL